ncbi:sialoadhesin isoform X1 [Thunnus albacares]|uniref:sialoadhesin isoform X1 n=1 Tax=Thunnus albacares TaxID=8236 RepID=UPI001CF6B5B5|nr:sialoadhesin isoform X1 [Thunnus albacares]
MGVGLAVVTLFITLMQVVLCKNWNLMLPQRIMAISGSCVTIPCHFEVPDDYESDIHNCSRGGVWKKGVATNPPVFSASNVHGNIIQGQTLGDETKKNCTTVFYSIPKNYSDIYFFRLECPNKAKFTFSNGVYIIIQPGPSPPKMTSMIQMLEGIQMMRLQCSVPVPCPALPPSLTWLPRDDSRQQQTQILQNQDGQMTMVSTLTFIASADLHNQSIICSVSYPLAKGGSTEPSATTQRLNIQYAPRFTEATLSVSGPVSEGHTVTFTCFSDANPPARNYTWYRDDSGMLTMMGDRGTLVLQVTKRDSGLYMCEAENQRGSQRSRLVSLEVVTAAESSECFMVFHYVICGVVVLLYILTVVVDVYKYQSLSRRLKQIELKGEHTYMDLRSLSVTSDYEQLQPQQPKTQPRPQVQNNEGTVAPQAIRKNKPQPKRT